MIRAGAFEYGLAAGHLRTISVNCRRAADIIHDTLGRPVHQIRQHLVCVTLSRSGRTAIEPTLGDNIVGEPVLRSDTRRPASVKTPPAPDGQ